MECRIAALSLTCTRSKLINEGSCEFRVIFGPKVGVFQRNRKLTGSFEDSPPPSVGVEDFGQFRRVRPRRARRTPDTLAPSQRMQISDADGSGSGSRTRQTPESRVRPVRGR